MKLTEQSKEQLAKKYPLWVLSETSIQKLLDLEVDSEVLCQELTRLGNMSGRIGVSYRDLRLLLQEQELPD